MYSQIYIHYNILHPSLNMHTYRSSAGAVNITALLLGGPMKAHQLHRQFPTSYSTQTPSSLDQTARHLFQAAACTPRLQALSGIHMQALNQCLGSTQTQPTPALVWHSSVTLSICSHQIAQMYLKSSFQCAVLVKHVIILPLSSGKVDLAKKEVRLFPLGKWKHDLQCFKS